MINYKYEYLTTILKMPGLGNKMAVEPSQQDGGEASSGRTGSPGTPNTNRGPSRPGPRCHVAAQAPPRHLATQAWHL